MPNEHTFGRCARPCPWADAERDTKTVEIGDCPHVSALVIRPTVRQVEGISGFRNGGDSYWHTAMRLHGARQR